MITLEILNEILDEREKFAELCKDYVVGPGTICCIYPFNDGLEAFYQIAEQLNKEVTEEPLGEQFLSDYRLYFEYRGMEISFYISDFELMKRKESLNG